MTVTDAGFMGIFTPVKGEIKFKIKQINRPKNARKNIVLKGLPVLISRIRYISAKRDAAQIIIIFAVSIKSLQILIL